MRSYSIKRTADLSKNDFVLFEPDLMLTHEYAHELIDIRNWCEEQFGTQGERWVMCRSEEVRFGTEVRFTHRRDAAVFRLRWW